MNLKFYCIALFSALAVMNNANAIDGNNGNGNGGCGVGQQTNGCGGKPAPTPTNPSNPSNTNNNTARGGNGTGVGIGIGQGGNSNATGGNGTAISGGNTMVGGSNTATGGHGGTSASSSSARGGNASQGQSQGITGSGNSDNTNNNHVSQGQSSRTSNDGSGNSENSSQISVDASDRSSNSYQHKTTFIPSVVPSSPATALGVGNVTAIVGVCGPLQTIVRTPIEGTYVGLFKKSKINQGYDESLAPFMKNGSQVVYNINPLPNGSVRYMGHQPIYFTTVIGISAARNIALGGSNSEGSWGQAGGGSSSSMQQLVTRIQLRDCEIPTETAIIQYVERKSINQ